MPAFKFLTKRGIDLINDRDYAGVQKVDIVKKDGHTEPVYWIGFRAQDLPSNEFGASWRYVKMVAVSVTPKSGVMSDPWKILLPSEYVVCVMVPFNASSAGVYTLLNDRGWPVVRGSGGSEKRYANN